MCRDVNEVKSRSNFSPSSFYHLLILFLVVNKVVFLTEKHLHFPTKNGIEVAFLYCVLYLWVYPELQSLVFFWCATKGFDPCYMCGPNNIIPDHHFNCTLFAFICFHSLPVKNRRSLGHISFIYFHVLFVCTCSLKTLISNGSELNKRDSNIFAVLSVTIWRFFPVTPIMCDSYVLIERIVFVICHLRGTVNVSVWMTTENISAKFGRHRSCERVLRYTVFMSLREFL